MKQSLNKIKEKLKKRCFMYYEVLGRIVGGQISYKIDMDLNIIQNVWEDVEIL